MKIQHIEKILNKMTNFEFWVFMKMPIRKRWGILRNKARKCLPRK